MLIICTQSGTVLQAKHCKLVNDEALTEEQQEPLWCGSDSEIIELANTYGESLCKLMTNGFMLFGLHAGMKIS